MDSFGGHGAFRLGLVRFGWASQGGSVLGWFGGLWSGQVGRGRIWLGGSGVLWSGQARWGKARRSRCVTVRFV